MARVPHGLNEVEFLANISLDMAALNLNEEHWMAILERLLCPFQDGEFMSLNIYLYKSNILVTIFVQAAWRYIDSVAGHAFKVLLYAGGLQAAERKVALQTVHRWRRN